MVPHDFMSQKLKKLQWAERLPFYTTDAAFFSYQCFLATCANSKYFSFQLRDTDDDLGTGSRVLSVMIMKVQRSRIVMAGVALAIIVIILVSIYLSFYG